MMQADARIFKAMSKIRQNRARSRLDSNLRFWTQQLRASCGSFSHRSGRLPGRVNPLKLKGWDELVASASVFTDFGSIDSN